MIKKNIEKRLSRITSLKTDNKIENNTISYDNILQFISIGKFQKALTCIIETAHNTNIANEFTSTLLMGLLNLKIKNTNEYIIYLTKLNTFSKKDKTVIIPQSYMHVIIETLKLFDINDIIKETKRTFHNLYLCYLMVGVAYLAPEPGAKPFVKVGDAVKAGDTVALVEAMKTFNPIKSDKDGVVKEILVTDGAAVEFDQPLIVIE